MKYFLRKKSVDVFRSGFGDLAWNIYNVQENTVILWFDTKISTKYNIFAV